MLNFIEPEISTRELFYSYVRGLPVSYYNFSNIFMWRRPMHYKFAVVCDTLCIFSQYRKEPPFVFFPQVYEQDKLKCVVETLKSEYSEHITFRPLIIEMVEHMRGIYPDAVITEERDLFDYLYDAKSLCELSGKKLHQKRTHVSNFKKLYDFEYHRVTPDENLELLRRAYEELYAFEDSSDNDFIDEHQAINELISNFGALGLRAGVITVGDKIAAYSIGERFSTCHALIHTEKADRNFEGAYAAINQLFVSTEFSECCYINREEDMGIPGLRKAKLSYEPAAFNKIYSLSI